LWFFGVAKNELPLISAGIIESLLGSAQRAEFYQLKHVATLLEISPRTLRRNLARQRISFTEILEKWRRDSALTLLQNTNQRVADIAIRLGYSHASNFERAFKRWTGHTPGSYRGKL
jgi:AraC-like DNA-binding protein